MLSSHFAKNIRAEIAHVESTLPLNRLRNPFDPVMRGFGLTQCLKCPAVIRNVRQLFRDCLIDLCQKPPPLLTPPAERISDIIRQILKPPSHDLIQIEDFRANGRHDVRTQCCVYVAIDKRILRVLQQPLHQIFQDPWNSLCRVASMGLRRCRCGLLQNHLLLRWRDAWQCRSQPGS